MKGTGNVFTDEWISKFSNRNQFMTAWGVTIFYQTKLVINQ